MSPSSDIELLILVVGSHSDSKIKGRTRIQKTVCALKFGDEVPFEFDFHSYFYGPYSDDLTDVINALVGIKILEEKMVPTGYGSYRYEYKLSKQGEKFFQKVQRKFNESNPDLLELIHSRIRTLEELNNRDLVNYAKSVSQMPSISREQFAELS
jgi:uncharacterized protein YwgA